MRQSIQSDARGFSSRPTFSSTGCMHVEIGAIFRIFGGESSGRFYSFASGAASDLRVEYAALKKLHDGQLPPTIARWSDAHLEWSQQKFRTLHDRGIAFMAAYPNHPLRWDVLVLLKWGRDHHVVVRVDGSRAIMPTPEEDALWNQKYYTMLGELLESTDASRSARHEALRQLIDYHCREVRNRKVDNPRVTIFPTLLKWVQEFHALDPRSGQLSYLYVRVARTLNGVDPELCRAFLAEKLALHPGEDFPDPRVRTEIANFQRLVRNQDTLADEFWQYLQKIDPTLNDLRPYKGKVVIVGYVPVDWTLRTVELEAAYRKYHAAGLFRSSRITKALMPLSSSATAWRWSVTLPKKRGPGG